MALNIYVTSGREEIRVYPGSAASVGVWLQEKGIAPVVSQQMDGAYILVTVVEFLHTF